MAIIDKWGVWFKDIKLAANVYFALAAVSGILLYIANNMVLPYTLLGFSAYALILDALLKGTLVVLTGYYTLVAAMLTKIVYTEMIRHGKARA